MFPSSPWVAAQIARHVYLERSRDAEAGRLARTARAASPASRPAEGPRIERPARSRRYWLRATRTTAA